MDERDHAPRPAAVDAIPAGAQRPASGASGSDRIVGTMSASGSYVGLSSDFGRGATMGPPACSAQSSPVVFRSCCRTRLQGLSASWDDWRGQKVFLIRKRSQVRVLDRPLVISLQTATFLAADRRAPGARQRDEVHLGCSCDLFLARRRGVVVRDVQRPRRRGSTCLTDQKSGWCGDEGQHRRRRFGLAETQLTP